jgi:hypothetical protein
MGAAMDSGFSAAVESVRLVRVLPKEPISSYKSALSWLAQIRNETNKLSASSGVKVGFTGEIVFMAEAGGGMEKDLSSTISASMGLIGLLALAAFWVLLFYRLRPQAVAPLSVTDAFEKRIILHDFAPYALATAALYFMINYASYGLWRYWLLCLGIVAAVFSLLMLKTTRHYIQYQNDSVK